MVSNFNILRGCEKIMEDFQILIGILASSSIAINIYIVKSISKLCERVTRLETEIEHHFNGKHDENKGRRFA